MKDNKFFQKNPDLKYAVLENSTFDSFYYLGNIYSQIPLSKLYDVARAEFEKAEDTASLAALFFGRMNFFNAHVIQQSKIIRQLQEENQQLKNHLQTL